MPARDFKLHAVMTVWNEADIIEATVRNLFAEGCDGVFLLDNGSEDETVERAVSAGATFMGQFLTDVFHDNTRTEKINELIRAVNAREGHERVWWLNLDADEFPTGPGPATVRGYLESLDDRIRCVGAWWINHYPDHRPFYLPGFHPADFQMLAGRQRPKTGFTIWGDYCSQNHVKHHLLRHDRGGPSWSFGLGAHVFASDEILSEPEGGILTHHFQFRDPVVTHRKLRKLTGKNEQGYSRHANRKSWEYWEKGMSDGTSKHQYSHRAAVAYSMYRPETQREILGFSPQNWKDVAAGFAGQDGEPCITRWYDDTLLFDAVNRKLSAEEFAVWKIRYLFNSRRFKDVLAVYEEGGGGGFLGSEDFGYVEVASMVLSGDVQQALSRFRSFRMQYPASRHTESLASMFCRERGAE
ncbi:MAG: glycosyltransferase family 2 protein [Pseudodesulfovibrio sp.]